MSRVFNAFLFGFIFLFMIDFIIFVGLKINYFELLKIGEYFNAYFIDSQPWLFLLIASPILGYFMLYFKLMRYVQLGYMIVLVGSTLTFAEPIGKDLGYLLFLKKDVELKAGANEFKADILYEGRKYMYIIREGYEGTIRVPYSDLRE